MPARSHTPQPVRPTSLRKTLRRFLNLKSEAEVTQVLGESGVILMSGAFNPTTWTPEQRDGFIRSWGLTTEDEVAEALQLAGLITVIHGDLAEAARSARYPLTVAKAIKAVVRGSEEDLRRVVPVLRQRGCSWTQIGVALGMTKQSAWERYSGED